MVKKLKKKNKETKMKKGYAITQCLKCGSKRVVMLSCETILCKNPKCMAVNIK